MKKNEFLATLRLQLRDLPQNEIDDIVRDQEEYIQDAMMAGRKEEDVIASLGDPKSFASNVTAENKIKSAEQSVSLSKQVTHTFGAVFALLALAPLNIIFVLGPFLFLAGLLFGGWAASAGLFMAAWGVLMAFVFKLVFMNVGIWVHLSSFFFVMGCIGATFLCLIAMFYVTRFFVQATLAYLRWNIKFFKNAR